MQEKQAVSFGPYQFEPHNAQLRRGTRVLPLTRKACEVLQCLVAHPGQLVTKEALFAAVWPEMAVSDGVLANCITELRQALGDDARRPRFIATVHRRGYRFIASLHPPAPARRTASQAPEHASAAGPSPHTAPLPVSPPATPSASAPAPLTAPPPPVAVPALGTAGPGGPSAVVPAGAGPPGVPPWGSMAGERKLATVLCWRPEWSAAAPDGDDPEAHYTRLEAFVELTTPEIHRYGGTVQHLLPDGVLALFGVPQTQEDHAQRAVLAALGVQRRVAALPSTPPLGLRTGVHTGLVVVGQLGTDIPSPYVAGEIAAGATHLAQTAAAGAIVVSATTARLVRLLVQLTAVAPPPGTAALGPCYQVQGLRPQRTPSPWGDERPLTPLVGRERELGVLQRVFEQVVAGQGQVVGLVGEPAIGKSRLLYEFRHSLQGQLVTYLTGRCLAYGSTTPYLPVLDILRQNCGLTETDPPDVVRAKVAQSLREVDLAPEDWAAPVLELLGVDAGPTVLTPQARKQRLFAALQQMSLQGSRKQPLIFEVEDLHWIDPTSEEYLMALVERLPGAAVLLLTTYRPGYQPPWLSKAYATQLALAPLRPPESQQVVQTLLQGSAPALVPFIVAKAGGNPFFLEELTRAAAAHGGAGGRWVVPDTIQAVLAARLDQLPAVEKQLLQVAAVIGPAVPFSLLQAVTELPEDTLQTSLMALRTARCLYETRLVPDPSYAFAHVLLQDVAYQALLRRTRQHYHQRIAQVLEERFPETADTQPELLAHHYTEAGLIAQAVPCWQRAGERASDRSAYVEAISHFTTGIELLKTLPATPEQLHQTLTLHIALGAVLQMAKGIAAPEVEHAYTRAYALCQQVGETPQIFPVLYGLLRFYMGRSQFHTARELGDTLLRLAQRAADPALAVIAHYALGATWFWLGVLPAARQHLEAGIALYTPDQRRAPAFRMGQDPGVSCRAYAAKTLWLLGYPEQALTRLHEALALAHTLSHPYSLAVVRCWAAYVYQWRRDVPAVYEQAEAAVALSTAQGFPHWEARGTSLRGWALAMQGQGAEGMTQVRQGITAWRATGAAVNVPYLCTVLAEVAAHLGHTADGLQALTEAHTLVEQYEERWWEAEVYRLHGVLLRRQPGTPQAEAETWLRQALDVARRQEAKSLGLRAAMSLSRLWQQQGKRAEARELLAPIYNWFSEGFDTADLQEARTLLEELGAP